jgi:hypothetical protein
MESCGTVLVALARVRAATSPSASWSLFSVAMWVLLMKKLDNDVRKSAKGIFLD